jgi:hypothetical protein
LPVKLLIRQYNDNIEQPIFDSKFHGGHTREQTLTFICPCIVNIILNYNQQDAAFLDLFISTDAVHVSGGHIGLLTACEQEQMLLLTSCQQTCMTQFHLFHDSS